MKKLIVLIAHYNNPEGLVETLRSIREPLPVDVMIVDDGSEQKPDETAIKEMYTNGTAHVEFLEQNAGVSVAANHGLLLIEKMGYRFTARLDCGDICHPGRFAKQLKYLEENPDTKLLGAWANIVSQEGKRLYVLKHPVSYKEIRKKMYLNSMFVNPTVVFCTELAKVAGYYPEKYSHAAQDYAFMFNVIEKYKAENYPEALLDYYVDDASISTRKRSLQVRNRLRIIREHFYFGYYPILGLVRNSLLLLMPRWLTTRVKTWLKGKNG